MAMQKQADEQPQAPVLHKHRRELVLRSLNDHVLVHTVMMWRIANGSREICAMERCVVTFDTMLAGTGHRRCVSSECAQPCARPGLAAARAAALTCETPPCLA